MYKRTQTRGCPESCSGDLPLHEQSNPCLHGIITWNNNGLKNDDDDDDESSRCSNA